MNQQTANPAPNESFDDMTPIGIDGPVDKGGSAGHGAAPGLDTFENDEYVTDPAEVEKALGKGKSDESDDVEPESDDTPVNNEFDGDTDDEEEGEEESVEDSEEAEESDKQESKNDGRSLKLKDGKDTLDLNPDATLKLKVNGKNEIVSVDELMKNYSGKVAYDKKFNELQEDFHDLKEEKETFGQERDQIVSEMQKIGQMLDNSDNPLEALFYLVDVSGRSMLDFNKSVVNHMQGEVENLMEMDDVEQDLYWRTKELDYIKNNQAAKDKGFKEQQTQRELQERTGRLRESNGVSEDQYFDASRKLKQLGYDESTPEQVVEYAKMEPHFNRADEIAAEFEEGLGDNEMDQFVTMLAKEISSAPNMSNDDAILIATRKLGWKLDNGDEDIETLNNELDSNSNNHTPDPTSYKRPEGTVESFDDFDDQFYDNQRSRY